METDVDSMLVPNVISNDEYLRIPEELREKIKVFVTSKYEEFVVSKAVLVSTKVNHEQKITCLENELAKIQQEHNNDKNQLTKTGQDLHTVESKLKTLENDLQTQQDLVQRLERENSEYRQQRNSALDERDSLQRLWERRAVELERIQEECKSLNLELKAANISKSEAITKYEEVKSLQESLLYKESRFEKERIFLNNTIKTLTDELNKHTSDLNQARRDYMNRLLTLEGQLSTNTEQFQTAERTIEELKTKLNISNEKIEKLSDKLKEQREDEIRLKETYDKELEAQRKMVELYKDKSCSADSKSEELTSGVKQLQQLLQEATQQYGDLEMEMNRRIVEHQEELAEKEQIIDRLKKELDDANELLKSAQHENLERTIESMSPAAAAASRMIKSGLTVTQIYSQYVSASDELLLTKEENKRLNHFINTIIEDIEEKAPYLKKQKEDYARTLLQVESAKTNMDAMLAELQKVTDEGNEAKKTASFHARENLRLKAELTDVSKQVCFLLKEVEQARAGFAGLPSNADVAGGEANSSSRIISEKLVTFGNIEELLLNNQKLLALVRELTSKKEDEEKEKDDLDPQELKERLEFYVVQFEEMKATMHNYEKMLEALKRQRNMYRNLYQNRSNSDDIEDTMETSPTKTISLPNSPHPAPDSQIDELQKKLLESEKALKELREETDSYRKERQTNDTMMAEQLESLRADLTRLQNSNCKMLAQLEFSEERFKVQQTNAAIYKKQISALEEKNRSYSDTIVKHEYTLLSLRERALASESKLARAEVQLENARHECSLLKEVEVRLQSECEMLRRERQSTSLVLADLDTIKTRLERTDADSRIKMESKLDEANRECSAIRRRLQEEEDRWRALQATLVAQLNSSKTGYEEEKSAADRLREDLAGARKELRSQASQLEELNKKLKELSLPPPPVDTGSNEFETLTKRLNELEARLSRSQSDLSLAQQQLQDARQQTETYREIAESSEIRLKEEMSSIEKYRQDTQNRLLEADNCEAALRKQLQEANTQLARITTGTTQSTTELNAQLIMGRDKLKKIQEELEQKKLELEEAHKNNVELLSSAQEAEEKYSREIVLHSNDIQALAKVREELLTKTNKLDRLEAEKSEAVQALQIGRSNWEERERKLREHLASVEQRLVDLNSQNSVLHDQIQSFSSQLALQQSLTEDSGNISLNRSLNTSLSEEEIKSTEQLVSVIKYLRKEKDIAYGKFEVIRTENLRLKTQLENSEKQLRTAQESLKAEAEVTDTSVATSAKHAELLRKVDMLNAITDSNRGLREEQSLLQSKVKELTERVKKLNSELEPAMKENREFSTKVEMLSSENSALRGEAGRLRQRVNFLVERSNKASPEDWRRLQQEREMLTKQLATEKELLKKSQDDLKVVRQDKARLEEQCKQQTEEVKRLSEELEQAQQRATRLQQELDSVKSQLLKKNSELATITEDLGAKEALLADIRNKEMQIRKIAKKYKLQYEEKKKAEEIASQSPLSTEVSPEAQEQFRNEGRREVEQRIKENEDRSTDTIKELTDQVSSTQVENESLRKENAIMKTAAMEREERSKQAKDLLKNAREKILQITEQKNNLARQLAEMQGRGDESPQLKAHYEARIARLVKENAEIRAEKQQEKDRLMREMELMAQRSNQLQRLLEKTQGSKPSTSTGADKGSVDPPTANIKPMAGSTSSGPKQLQAQQAVAPWSGRGETPFASIRPMSQSRTVAVLQPTTQQASSNGSCAVLVPPLQQCVHTTGPSEALSSSPTSSHTDYMPATSSAGPTVRQVVVLQPTQQIPSAESTQDMEAESISEAQAPPAQSPQGPQQQVVALVLPQQTSQSQAASSSTTVTTSQAGSKRPRDIEAGSEQPKLGPQVKRTRTVASGSQEMFQTVTSEGGVEVEYQVPTSSQRDQEDDIIVLDSEEEEGLADEGAIEEPDDGPEFEGEADNGESYGIEGYDRDEQELADYDEGEGPDIDEDQAAQDSNEVDVVDDSSEVPNQSQAASESNVGQSGQAAGSCVDPPSQQHSEATSSGPEGGSVGTSQPLRGRTVPPLTRQQQQQLLLPQSYEDAGDDSIVPSTPTLFVPRRSDGFGEAVSSPQVPQGRFIFSETNPPTARAGVAQVASEGMDDTRIDLSQMDEQGTGRSVPTTPLQASPQGEVGQSMESDRDQMEDTQVSHTDDGNVPSGIPSITITQDPDDQPSLQLEGDDESEQEGSVEQSLDQEEGLDLAEEGDGVSSEGEKLSTMEEVEEGREAEASEVPSLSNRTRSGTARRSGRVAFRSRSRTVVRPTPIVWNEPGSTSSRGREQAARALAAPGAPTPVERGAPFPRATRGRRTRGKPKAGFAPPYHMRF